MVSVDLRQIKIKSKFSGGIKMKKLATLTMAAALVSAASIAAVSYTHLTLPTILLV